MFDPIKASANIKRDFMSYITTTHKFSDTKLNSIFKVKLENSISNGPFVEVNGIYEQGKTLSELISEDDSFSKLLFELEKNKKSEWIIPLGRKLYKHQEIAVTKAVHGRNVIVSTGTGSGKTLCFLIPVINSLLKESEESPDHKLSDGVRAIFIFPMNALANDQIKNVRHLLRDYPEITFGVYNGATEYEDEEGKDRYEQMFASETDEKLRKPLPNERVSRDTMREHPPHILFTNYAMLEHLLLNPQDASLFNSANMKYVVLDEAHTYSGISGIETAFLISRLKERFSGESAQFILTSATLGRERDSNEDIIRFAHNLCGSHFDVSDIVTSEYEEHISSSESGSVNISEILNNPFYDYIDDNDDNLKEKLYDDIRKSKEYLILRENWSGVHRIDELAQGLKITNDDLLKFLNLMTKARKKGKALIDIKYHFFIRCLDGCYMSFYPNRDLSFVPRKQATVEGVDTTMFEIGLCDHCGEIAIVGKIKDNKLIYSKIADSDAQCFAIDSENNDTELLTDGEIDSVGDDDTPYWLCPKCGTIKHQMMPPNSCVEHPDVKYMKLHKARKTDSERFRCCHCGEDFIKRFYLGNEAATSVLGTSLYEELYSANPNSVPQFLVFSDSRQEAARYACYVEEYYNKEITHRRAIYQLSQILIRNSGVNHCNFKYFAERLETIFSDSGLYENEWDCKSNAWVALLNELARTDSSTSLPSLGLVQFKYHNMQLFDELYEQYKDDVSSKHQFNELINLLTMEIVKMGAVKPESILLSADDRKYLFYSTKQKEVYLYSDSDDDRITQWIPKNKNRPDEFTNTKRMAYVTQVLNTNDKRKSADFLKQFFRILSSKYNSTGEEKVILLAEDFDVIFGDEIELYKCTHCGHVSPYKLNGKCIVANCGHQCEKIDPTLVNADNHYAHLYCESNGIKLLKIKEHTAQLSKQESLDYQEKFIHKEINALSCSTTFEMGVDIGSLEAVFLRNIPPTPSNYSQRAGRAGRSVDSAAYVLSYAKLNSHDITFFNKPTEIISGVINPPYFKLDNEKIAIRHVYAVALSLFFRITGSPFDFDNFVSKQEGYKQFCEWLDTKPHDLQDELIHAIPDDNDLHNKLGINDFSWCDNLYGQDDGVLAIAIKDYVDTKKKIESIIKERQGGKSIIDLSKEDYELIGKYRDRLKLLGSEDLISFLARNNVLPRHGFPIDTVELKENITEGFYKKHDNNPNRLQLSRDLKIAISEYAPSSEVIADGHVYTSRYINKPVVMQNGKVWYEGYVAECPYCHEINFFQVEEPGKCKSCQRDINTAYFRRTLEPRDGFTAESNVRKATMDSPERNFSSRAVFLGNSKSDLTTMNTVMNGHKIHIESLTNADLMIHSDGCFYVCDTCGYSLDSDSGVDNKTIDKKAFKEQLETVAIKRPHKNKEGMECNSKELHKYYLHHIFKTDISIISFPDLELDIADEAKAYSVLYAVYNAIAEYYQIEKREFNCCPLINLSENTKKLTYSLVMYDSVPGGAGYSRRLTTNSEEIKDIIFMAFAKVHFCNCDPSCYRCLRNYDNRQFHEILDRNLASDFLENFIEDF